MRLFLFALCCAFAVLASAEDRKGGPAPEKAREQTPEQVLESMTEGLKLDPKQSEKINALGKEYFEHTKAKGEEAKTLRERLRALELDLTEQTRRFEENVRAELTLEQKDRFDMLHMRRRGGGPGRGEERREFRFERRGPGGRGGPPGMGDDGPGRFPPEMWQGGRGGPGEGRGGPGEPEPAEPPNDD